MKITLNPISPSKPALQRRFDAIETLAADPSEAADQVADWLRRNVECPVHHQQPREVEVSLNLGGEPAFRIKRVEGCCGELEAEVVRVLGGVGVESGRLVTRPRA